MSDAKVNDKQRREREGRKGGWEGGRLGLDEGCGYRNDRITGLCSRHEAAV